MSSKEKIDVVKVLIQNENGELLMLKKSDNYGFMSNKWEQPGGKIEEGEDRFEAARREVKEETALEIDDLEDLVRLEIEEDENCLNCYVVLADSFSGEIEIEDEHQDYRWINKEEVREFDWHRDAAYIIPVIEYLPDYLD